MNFERNEGTEQEIVIDWCGIMSHQHPELTMIYHVPNGGKRGKAEAARFKRQGVKPGVPDLVLPVPKRGYHGMYIEMKYGKNKPSEDQKEWMAKLTEQGYFCKVCWGADEAIKTICAYLGIKGV